MVIILHDEKIQKINRCSQDQAISLTKDSIEWAHQVSFSHLKAQPSSPSLQRPFVVQCKKLIRNHKKVTLA